ncbi:MAG TPA: hypothetical protein DCE41_28235, partial [Cytophagales bacterium]|nr:hypothetical protein [Cytophagales bacterium]
TTSESVTITVTAPDNGGGGGGGGGTNPCAFGAPQASALASISNSQYSNIYVLGSGGPDVSNWTNFTINWDAANNGLYQFSVLTNNGVPSWYNDLLPSVSHTFGSAEPEVSISGSGITGLDGDYYATTDGGNFVLVSKTGGFTIYCSETAGAPTCAASRGSVAQASAEPAVAALQLALYPNPTADSPTLAVLASEAGTAKVLVVDLMGRTVYQEQLTLQPGTHQITLPIQEQPSGTYLVQVQTTNRHYQQVLVKE